MTYSYDEIRVCSHAYDSTIIIVYTEQFATELQIATTKALVNNKKHL